MQKKDGREVYNDYKAEQFLSKYLPISENQLVSSYKSIKIKAPLVLKIISDDALHKTDIGGVRIVKHQTEVKDNFNALLAIAKKRKLKLQGIMAQKFVEGEQLIIGIKKDAVFNHVILFGVGGVFTELFEDTSTRKCPITEDDAKEMVEELKAKKLFHGFRGEKLNLPFLIKTLVKASHIPLKHRNIEEMDINPFILGEKSGKVVDARIVFS